MIKKLGVSIALLVFIQLGYSQIVVGSYTGVTQLSNITSVCTPIVNTTLGDVNFATNSAVEIPIGTAFTGTWANGLAYTNMPGPEILCVSVHTEEWWDVQLLLSDMSFTPAISAQMITIEDNITLDFYDCSATLYTNFFYDRRVAALDFTSFVIPAGLQVIGARFTLTLDNAANPDPIGMLLLQGLTGSSPGVSNNGPICIGDTLELYADTVAGSTYSWTGPVGFSSFLQNPIIINATLANAGTYTCYITDSLSSIDTAYTTVVINPNSSATFITDTTICPGDQVTWTVPSGVVENVIWWDGSSDTAKTVGSGLYTVQYDVIGGCPGTDTATVSVYSLGSAGLPNDMEICFPDTVFLTTNVVGATSYLWQDNSTLSTFNVMTPGTYFVDVTLTNCHIYDTVNIAQKYLNVNLLPDTAWFCIGEDVLVKANLDNAIYLWSTGSIAQFEVFNAVGTVSLFANQAGCTAADTMDITEVTCYCNIFVPNSFTPNNDHQNELFQPIICPELNFYTMTIFNRWGQEIFRTSDPFAGWDGKHGGKDAPVGIYTYMINYDSYAVYENEKTVRGQVNLIR